jgi:hypothetical protein
MTRIRSPLEVRFTVSEIPESRLAAGCGADDAAETAKAIAKLSAAEVAPSELMRSAERRVMDLSEQCRPSTASTCTRTVPFHADVQGATNIRFLRPPSRLRSGVRDDVRALPAPSAH